MEGILNWVILGFMLNLSVVAAQALQIFHMPVCVVTMICWAPDLLWDAPEPMGFRDAWARFLGWCLYTAAYGVDNYLGIRKGSGFMATPSVFRVLAVNGFSRAKLAKAHALCWCGTDLICGIQEIMLVGNLTEGY